MAENQLHILERISQYLLQHELRLTTAESCTGGGLAHFITSLPGSSDWFDCGFVTYSNNAKRNLLGVHQLSLNNFGAVSEEVAIEMVRGAMEKADAQVSISVTGIAGPGGGSKEKPVGTVWIAWGMPVKEPTSRCFHFKGDRENVRKQTIDAAFIGLLDLLTN